MDPHFGEQFEVATATAEYGRIVAEVPRVFVGTEDDIELLVQLLCRELQRAFKQQGTHLPPWRSASSMLSKWRPRNCIDLPLPSSHPESAGTQQCLDGTCRTRGASSAPAPANCAAGMANVSNEGGVARHRLSQNYVLHSTTSDQLCQQVPPKAVDSSSLTLMPKYGFLTQDWSATSNSDELLRASN